jgi:hypothetical protein
MNESWHARILLGFKTTRFGRIENTKPVFATTVSSEVCRSLFASWRLYLMISTLVPKQGYWWSRNGFCYVPRYVSCALCIECLALHADKVKHPTYSYEHGQGQLPTDLHVWHRTYCTISPALNIPTDRSSSLGHLKDELTTSPLIPLLGTVNHLERCLTVGVP